jgi:predicted transcriptional regulator
MMTKNHQKLSDKAAEIKETQAFSVRLPLKLYQELRKVAFKQNKKMNVMMNQAIKQYLETIKEKSKK